MVFDPRQFGPAACSLLAIDAPYALVPQRPVEAAREQLAAFDDATLFAGQRIVDRAMADAALAGLWLRFDFLDESHTLSQGLETPTGSYWHGIMHRREADWGNAKYWFARVGQHPVYHELIAAMPRIAGAQEQGLTKGTWDAAKFVDLAERATRTGGALEELCRQVQIAEWQLLFEYSYRQALAAR